ncbi:MAG: tetratricopeptide repeat protein [Candidatus Methylomirabilaceae bacterium]
MTYYTTREVAKILDLPEERIRSCVRAGFLSPERGPGRTYQFTFEDLLLLRTTRDLLSAHVPVGRIRRMLGSLRRQLPDDQHVSSLTIYADGRRIVAWDGDARWQPDSGQFLFNFDVGDLAERVPLPSPIDRRASSVQPRTADEWFHLALELDATSPDEARQAYEHALEADPNLADAHVNVGRLYHEAKDAARAETHYRAALARAPEDPVAHFNLAVLLDDLGRHREAIAAYQQAITTDPDFADAHYNLGLLYESMGKRTEAIEHLRTARTLYGRSGTRL